MNTSHCTKLTIAPLAHIAGIGNVRVAVNVVHHLVLGRKSQARASLESRVEWLADLPRTANFN